jgi:5-hydroxyisourate hydrolase-like protein (transthyretin family)
MNKLSKKILSALLAAGTAAASIPVFAAIPEDVAGTRYEEPVQVLSALKIMIGDENGKFRLDDTIIRSEVAKMAVHAIGLEDAADAAKGTTKFDDVSTEHWANGYINIATQQGLIEGDGDGNFRPNDPISYAEAMTIMVRATGYEVSAQDKGGYPQGYISVATSNGLSKNVTGSSSDPISRGNVAYLTTNALEVNLMEQTSYGSTVKYEVTDKTLLKDKLEVTKDEGQIEAIEKTSLSGTSSLSKGQLKIDGKTYDTAYNMNNLLGYNVTYYAKETSSGNDEIILAMPIKNRNSELVINADLFSQLTTKNSNTAIEYYKDENNSKTTTAELSSNYVLIYNGKYEEKNTDLLDISDKAGKITLLDADKDGKYEIVFVTVYENMVVEEITASNKIVDKYSGKSLKLDDVDYRITKGLEEIEISDLKEYDVLSIAASLDNELYDITVTNTSVEGKITGTDSNGVYIDGEHFKIANNYTDILSIGIEGTFYLDVEGKIAAVDTASRLSSGYAYLIKAYTDNGKETSSFKIFTKSGEEVILEANSKIKLNDSTVQAEDAVKALTLENGETDKQLITYATNADGKLTTVKTAKDNSSTGAVDINSFTKNYVLSDAEYSAVQSKLGNVRIGSDTIIFDIDENSKDYAIRTKDVFEDEQKYDAIVYDMTENYNAKVVVLTNSAVKASTDASIAVVKSIASATNADDEQTDLLVALSDGKEIEIYAEDETVLVKDGNKLESGDIIQYKTNSDNEIVSIRLLFDVASKDNEVQNQPIENLVTVYGKVTKKFTNSINVTVDNSSVVNYELLSDIKVYSVDTTKSKNNITTASISDIQSYDEDENNRIFLKIYKDVVQEAVIVK